MCRCDYEYGGDLLSPLPSGKNPYKLWSLSFYFNSIYVANYLYILFILIVNEFWEDLIGNNVLNTCYQDTVKYWLLLHFIKPIATMIIINCCGLHKLMCCACSKICVISFLMLSFDILLCVLSLMYCWLDLFKIYYGGNQYCNIPLSHPHAQYDYATSSLVFILLSFIGVQFVFIWLELFRFIEVLIFQSNKQKLKELKNKKRRQNKQHPNNVYLSVDMEDVSQSIDPDNNVIDIVYPMDQIDGNEQKVDEWIQELFVYGDGQINHNDNDNNNDAERVEPVSDEATKDKHASSIHNLSEFWRATTTVVTTGFILTLTADDFCCVCWEEFEIGQDIAKLYCGHIIHKKCAIEWFEQSVTCPTCRVELTKE
eukprot:604357_1